MDRHRQGCNTDGAIGQAGTKSENVGWEQLPREGEGKPYCDFLQLILHNSSARLSDLERIHLWQPNPGRTEQCIQGADDCLLRPQILSSGATLRLFSLSLYICRAFSIPCTRVWICPSWNSCCPMPPVWIGPSRWWSNDPWSTLALYADWLRMNSISPRALTKISLSASISIDPWGA